MAEVWAEKILSLGYHKTVWHKVADGDLPKEASLYLCKMKHKGLYGYEYKVLFFDDIFGFYNIINDEILAWTELPEYKE